MALTLSLLPQNRGMWWPHLGVATRLIAPSSGAVTSELGWGSAQGCGYRRLLSAGAFWILARLGHWEAAELGEGGPQGFGDHGAGVSGSSLSDACFPPTCPLPCGTRFNCSQAGGWAWRSSCPGLYRVLGIVMCRFLTHGHGCWKPGRGLSSPGPWKIKAVACLP